MSTNKSAHKVKPSINSHMLLSNALKPSSYKITTKTIDAGRATLTNQSTNLNSNKSKISEYISKRLTESKQTTVNKQRMLTLLSPTSIKSKQFSEKRANITPNNLVSKEKSLFSRNKLSSMDSSQLNISTNEKKSQHKVNNSTETDNASFKICFKKPFKGISLDKSRNRDLDLSKLTMPADVETKSLLTRKSLSKGKASQLNDEIKFVDRKESINQDNSLCLKTDSNPENQGTREDRRVDTFNMKTVALETSFSENICYQAVETISVNENLLLNEFRYKELSTKFNNLKEEKTIMENNLKDYQHYANILGEYICTLKNRHKKETQELEQTISMLTEEKYLLKSHIENIIRENQTLKLKFLHMFTALNSYEDACLIYNNSNNEKIMAQLMKENEYLREVSSKIIFTENVVTKEIKGDSIDDLEKFKTNYLEEYKKYKSNQIKEELNINTTFQTIKTEETKEPLQLQPRTHFIPPFSKINKPKRKLKDIKISTDIKDDVGQEFLCKTENGMDQVIINLKGSFETPFQSPLFPTMPDLPNKPSYFPMLLNESFEIAPMDESPKKQTLKFK